jgi:hypothetical protein
MLVSFSGNYSQNFDALAAAGSQPADTVARVEFATPGVTAPGLEKVLDDVEAASGEPQWASERVIASGDLNLSLLVEQGAAIRWQPGWQELDLVFGMAIDAASNHTLLNPADFATLPRAGVQLADVSVLGSNNNDRIFVGIGSQIHAGGGGDEFFNSDSQGANLLIGGADGDRFFLRAVADRVIGGALLSGAAALGLSPFTALVDHEQDSFLIDSSAPGGAGALQIEDFELGVDVLLVDGVAPAGDWATVREGLRALGIMVNAAPQLDLPLIALSLQPGVEVSRNLASLASDPDGDPLQLVMLEGPAWITTSGSTVRATAPLGISEEELAALNLRLALSDGKAAAPLAARLALNAPPTALALTNAVTSLAENISTEARIKVADITISDDGLGTNAITLAGADAASFEVIGGGLFLKAGTALDFETQSSLAVTVTARDPSLLGSTPVSAGFTLAITDVEEPPADGDTRPPGSSGTTEVSITLPNGEIRSIPFTFDNAALVDGTSLSVIRDLRIDPAGLSALAQLGIQSNGTGLDFQLAVEPGASGSLYALIELVAADLLPELTAPSGNRLPARKLLYYGVSAGGALSTLTYDPITGAGARFYDLNNDGSADFFALRLIDGGYGDKDGLANSVIVDPSFAGFAELSQLQFSSGDSGTLTVSDPSNAAPAAVSLRASLTRRPASVNQIGYVVLNASEVANADALLRDLSWLRGRAQTLFSSLASNDVTLPPGISFARDIQLINGQSLRFFEVKAASLNELTSLGDHRFRHFTLDEYNIAQAGFSSSSGVRFNLTLLPNDPGLNALISNAQGLAPVLDLSAFTSTQTLGGTLTLGREADLDSVTGFYRSLDAEGAVLTADGFTRLRPGDSGYANAALNSNNIVGQLSKLKVGDDQTSSRSFSGVSGGSFLAPFAAVNGNTFFAFGAANKDGISHFRSLGNNLFGLEDQLGGGDHDFDDLVIGFTFTSLV